MDFGISIINFSVLPVSNSSKIICVVEAGLLEGHFSARNLALSHSCAHEPQRGRVLLSVLNPFPVGATACYSGAGAQRGTSRRCLLSYSSHSHSKPGVCWVPSHLHSFLEQEMLSFVYALWSLLSFDLSGEFLALS